jgi:soluble lytic murein transglycosylase-like protein
MRKGCIEVKGVAPANGKAKTALPLDLASSALRNSAVLLAAVWTVLVPPTRAQIASYVNEHGKLVYTNEDSPAALTAGATSASSGKSAARLTLPAPPARLERVVHEVAERQSMDPALVNAVISAESGWNPFAVSRKGAVGLMQLIPGTAQRFGVGNLFDPVQNIEGGTMYLKTLLRRYNGDLNKSLAAYNAGERAVDLSGGVPPIWETQRYVQKVTDAYFRPGSGRDTTLWDPPRNPVRREVDAKGRVLFTNE